ncbi:ADP-ribosyltransferase [Bacillus thuringiensis]|uniref:ADP-ribosyltransferase n=1 Tax=Bacillus thuringiensis TaxID=1428 RepID=A0ABD6QZM0_BACTU|nr:ADP-ribosyltransferase [Bacillus thuringiensis]OPD40961.1 ADP-ribosyltransferase [Bacillus thuringiensis]
MLSKKVAFFSLATIVLMSGTANVASAMEQSSTLDYPISSIESTKKTDTFLDKLIDFKDKEKEAKNYGKNLPNHRDKIVVTPKAKEAFNNYEQNGTRINQALREGKVDGYPKEYVKVAKEYAAEMDKVFKQNTASVPDTIMVYRYTDEQQFGIAPGTFFPKDPKNPKETIVNKESIEKFKKKFEGKTVKDKGFTSTSLAILDKYLGEKSKTIRMDIEVPKGTHAVYMGNEYAELILPRNASLKIKKVSGIVEKGKLIVKVDASVVNK